MDSLDEISKIYKEIQKTFSNIEKDFDEISVTIKDLRKWCDKEYKFLNDCEIAKKNWDKRINEFKKDLKIIVDK